MIIEIKYFNGAKKISHTIKNEYTKTELHCLNCGEKGVFSEDNGDYYEGERHVCLSCDFYFSVPSFPENGLEHEQIKQVLEALKSD